MLKACWECIGGSEMIRQRQGEDPYSVHLNGGSRSSPWANTSNMSIYQLPTRVNPQNSIIIVGQATNDNILSIALNGENGPLFSLEADFDSNQIIVKPSPDDQLLVNNHFSEDKSFKMEFIIYENYFKVTNEDNDILGMPTDKFDKPNWFEDLRYLSVNNVLRQLSFNFDVTY